MHAMPAGQFPERIKLGVHLLSYVIVRFIHEHVLYITGN